MVPWHQVLLIFRKQLSLVSCLAEDKCLIIISVLQTQADMDSVWSVFITTDLHGGCVPFIVALFLILGDTQSLCKVSVE